jgi:hypothetical protein
MQAAKDGSAPEKLLLWPRKSFSAVQIAKDGSPSTKSSDGELKFVTPRNPSRLLTQKVFVPAP